jgi:hypothetical protein
MDSLARDNSYTSYSRIRMGHYILEQN